MFNNLFFFLLQYKTHKVAEIVTKNFNKTLEANHDLALGLDVRYIVISQLFNAKKNIKTYVFMNFVKHQPRTNRNR